MSQHTNRLAYAYADNINLLRNKVNITKKNRKFTDASKEIGLEVNTEKTKYRLMSRHKNEGQNHEIKIVNRWV
jgi:hypothetical protein